MKELSIEEKAKRYDEAIKRAQAKMEEAKVFDYDDEQTAHTIRLTTTDILPELAESEDERIRKEMIFYFQEEIPQCSIQEHADKMKKFISWLKRQEVERTKLELKAGNSYFCYKSRWERADSETFKKGLIYKCNKDGVLDNFVIKNPEQHFIEIKDERIAWLKKQGEQKPVETEKGTKGNEREIPNSAWSEEDESMLYGVMETEQYMLDVVNGIKKFDVGNGAIRKACTQELNWLKSLRDRVQPQPKQEWSDEDEKMYARIVRSYTSYEGRILYATNLSEDNRNNILEDLNEQELWLKYRLKSLRPQKQCCNDVPSREYILNVWELGNYWKELTKGVCSTEHGTQLEYIQNHWKEGEYYDKISVCPQKQWKPSEGQVKALLWVIENTTKSKDVNILLNSLYEDLKAL